MTLEELQADAGVTRIPLKGVHGSGKFALVDGDYDGEYLSQFPWCVNKGGYVYRRSWKYFDGTTTGTIYLHDMVCSKPPGMWVDHINRNKLDNRSCNLRPVTPRESATNRGYGLRYRVRKNGGYRGVSKARTGPFWVAKCSKTYLGWKYETPEAAARAYDTAATALWADEAILNFPRKP